MARIIAVVFAVVSLLAMARSEDTKAMMNKVPVTVYYESLCPDSIKFFVEQLYPTWSNLSDYMDLTLVPYGRANHSMAEDGKFKFECKHGEMECVGNIVQVCAIKKVSMVEQMKFINCVMSMSASQDKTASYPGKQCAGTVGIVNYTPIEQCVAEEGGMLLAEMGNKTMELKPKLESVPAVVFKSEYKPSEQSKYRSDFKSALCSMIMGEKPEGCKSKMGKNSAGSLIPGYIVSLSIISTILSRM